MENQTFTQKWTVDQPRAIVHIIHGMSEHIGRYDHFAKALNKAGYSAIGSDLRGHGKTAGSIENIGFFADQDGWNLVVQDAIQLTKEIKAENPNVPVFILGHSMGSFIARTLAFTDPDLVDGYLLSATIGHPGWKGIVGKPMSKLMGALFGKKKPSKFLADTSFAGFSKRIKDKRTNKDWLTRDPKIVDQYIADPFCMQIFSNQFFNDLAIGVLEISKKSNIEKVSKNTPVVFISGSMDPAGEYGKGPTEVFEKYKSANVENVDLHLFEGGRHEILNETNREEIYGFIVQWLNDKTPTS